MRRLAIVALVLAPFMALGATVVAIIYQRSSGVPLTAPAPTENSGHPLGAAVAIDAGLDLASSYAPTHVWCELESNGTITGGTLKWYKRSDQTDGGWGYAPGLDETIPNIGQARFISLPLKLAAIDGRIYCQPSAVTESGGDGGLRVIYGFRMERP